MKAFKRILSLSLVAVMMFVYYIASPAKTLADEIEEQRAIEAYAETNSFSGSQELPYSPLVGEDAAGRAESVRVFLREDGAREAVVYAEPVNYLMNGAWQPIDNTLTLVTLEDGTQVYRNTASDFIVSFAPLFSSSRLVTVETGGQSLSWRFVGAETTDSMPEPTPEPMITTEPIILPPEADQSIASEPETETAATPENEQMVDTETTDPSDAQPETDMQPADPAVDSEGPVAEEAASESEVSAEGPVAEEASSESEVSAEVPVAEEASSESEVSVEVPVAEEASSESEVSAEVPVAEEASSESEVSAELPDAEKTTLELEIIEPEAENAPGATPAPEVEADSTEPAASEEQLPAEDELTEAAFDLSLFDTLAITDAVAQIVTNTETFSAESAEAVAALTDEERDMQLRFPSSLQSEIAYVDPATGLNVRYVLSGKTLREYITLASAPERAVAYSVEIQATGVTPATDESGATAFVNASGQPVFTLGQAVMYDAAGEQSSAIEAHLSEFNADTGTCTYTLIPDTEWLQSADRQYPLSIDPDVSINISGSIQDTYVASAHKNSNYSNGESMNIGGTAAEGLVYIPNSILPVLSSGDVVLQSCLYLSRHNSNSSYSNATSAVYRVTSSWNASNVTWNTKPSYDSSGSISFGVSSVRYHANPFDITRAVKDWYETPSSNLGLLFKGTSGSSLFCTSEYSGTASRRPYLTVIYRNSTGLEDTWTYYSQSIGRAGTGSVNAFSGNLTMTHADASVSNGVLPISLSHVYNTNDRTANIGYGYGWRLNYAQSLKKVSVTSLNGTATYYQHIDGDGTRHYYKANGTSTTQYINELDKDSVLTISGATVTITDKSDNKLIFGCDSSVANGRLTTIRDANGNETNIAYTTTTITNLRISSITEKLAGNAAGQTLALTYENNLLAAVTAPDGLNVSYAYTSSKLSGITYADGKSISYQYNGNNCLTKATNIDAYSIFYSYTTGAPYRVTRVGEAAGSTNGQHLTFTYGRNKTTVADAQGRRTVYHTDNIGQPVSVTDPEGRAVFATYNTASQTVTQLKAVSKMQMTVVNLLKNHGFEESTWPSSWTRSDTGNIKNDSSRRHTGAYSCRITAGSAARTLSQSVSVTSGQTYTLSAYFSGTLNTAYLRVTNGSSTIQSPAVTAGGTGWNRESLTFTAAGSSITVSVIVPAGSGTVFVDSIQLEKSAAPNRYNMVMNSDFTSGTANYTMNYGVDCAIIDVANAKYAAARSTHPSFLDSKVYEMNGKLQAAKIKQTYLSGSTGDTYTFGAWVASNNIPQTAQRVYYGTSGSNHTATYGIKRLVLQFLNSSGTVVCSGHVDFAADTDEWQFASGTVTTTSSYAQMQLVVEYTDSLNVLYVDGLQLHKEQFASGYSYDSSGNLTGTVSLIGQQNSFGYDSNDNLTSMTDARGNTTTYTYDSKHNLLTSTSPQGVVTTNTYNAAGLPTETKVGNSTSYIRTTTAYDSASALATSVTDARGNTVLTQYDAAKRLATQITDAKGQTAVYGHDSMNRVSAITSGNSGVSYTYASDKLTQVNVDGAVFYGLTYDGFGRTISTKAGSSADSMTTLATNTYNNTSGLLYKTVYANGLSVSYVYDRLDRPVEVKYNGTSMYQYVYDGAGNLYSARDVALGFTVFYEYDHTGRCMKSVTKNSAGTVLASYQYQYDGNDNLTKLTCTTNGTTWATTYAYDKDNRPTTATLANGKAITNAYDAIGRLSTRKIGTYTTALSYVAGTNGSQTALVSSYRNGADAAIQYTYDANGNITHIQQDTAHIYYQYDALNQLIREDNSALNKSIVYTYDDRGNLLTKQEYAYVADGGTLGEPTDTIAYGYDSANQQWADQLTSYDGEAIRYDASGNPTTYRGYTMTWQGRRLTGATDGTTTTAYTYDENGLRTQKTVNGTATQYRYHGSVLISQVSGSDNLLFSYDANGNVVAVNYNGTYYYYVRNGQNDVIRLIDGSNNSVVEYSYDSWGKQISCTGSLASTLGTQNPFRYRGYVYDTETGLYYLQTRYYDPEVGRFINADIYVSTGQGVLGNNMYTYCGNNPIVRADDEGDFWNFAIGAAVGAIAGFVSSVVSDVIEGKEVDFGKAAIGAAFGAVNGLVSASGLGFVAQAGIAAGLGAAESLSKQAYNHRNDDSWDVNWVDVSVSAGLNALGSLGGSLVWAKSGYTKTARGILKHAQHRIDNGSVKRGLQIAASTVNLYNGARGVASVGGSVFSLTLNTIKTTVASIW